MVNAFLWTTIDRYVSSLNTELRDKGLSDDVMVMQANGGIVRPKQMTGVGSLSSGPAGGMIATRFMAEVLGHANVITCDMGGTSFDVGLLTDHRLGHAREPIAERFRLLQPMIDVADMYFVASSVIPATGTTIERAKTRASASAIAGTADATSRSTRRSRAAATTCGMPNAIGTSTIVSLMRVPTNTTGASSNDVTRGDLSRRASMISSPPNSDVSERASIFTG